MFYYSQYMSCLIIMQYFLISKTNLSINYSKQLNLITIVDDVVYKNYEYLKYSNSNR